MLVANFANNGQTNAIRVRITSASGTIYSKTIVCIHLGMVMLSMLPILHACKLETGGVESTTTNRKQVQFYIKICLLQALCALKRSAELTLPINKIK